MNLAFQLLALVLAIPAVLACGYLLLLTLLSGRPAGPPPASRRQRFDIIVPAHNESAVILRTLAGLAAIDWPAERFRAIVVADNCSDDTAARAAAAGAEVWRRDDPARRGKGHALEFAFARSRAEGRADAVVVIDADAVVSPNLLTAIGARLDGGAEAVQVHYGILNPDTSWRTRLLTIAKAAFHIVRSRARERLALSCGIRGNGWCVTHALLARHPYRYFSLTEDLEFGLALGVAGVRVAYADEAHSRAEMVSGGSAAGRQRQRWEQGRLALMRGRAWTLLVAGVTRPSRVCLDLAADLLVLPVAYVALNVSVLAGVAAAGTMAGLPAAGWLWTAGVCALAVTAYVLRGWQLSGVGLRGLLDLARAPFFLVWKLLLLRKPEPREWVRTDREGP